MERTKATRILAMLGELSAVIFVGTELASCGIEKQILKIQISLVHSRTKLLLINSVTGICNLND